MVKSRSELEGTAALIFETLERDFKPCEVVYILSELTRRQSLAMLQREREELISDALTRSMGTTRVLAPNGGEV